MEGQQHALQRRQVRARQMVATEVDTILAVFKSVLGWEKKFLILLKVE